MLAEQRDEANASRLWNELKGCEDSQRLASSEGAKLQDDIELRDRALIGVCKAVDIVRRQLRLDQFFETCFGRTENTESLQSASLLDLQVIVELPTIDLKFVRCWVGRCIRDHVGREIRIRFILRENGTLDLVAQKHAIVRVANAAAHQTNVLKSVAEHILARWRWLIIRVTLEDDAVVLKVSRHESMAQVGLELRPVRRVRVADVGTVSLETVMQHLSEVGRDIVEIHAEDLIAVHQLERVSTRL